MSYESGFDVRAFLQEFQEQPKEIREIFLYVVCRTMVEVGLLQFLGAFNNPGLGVTLLYRNPDTKEVFEVVKPKMSDEEERAMQGRIKELLQENARAV